MATIISVGALWTVPAHAAVVYVESGITDPKPQYCSPDLCIETVVFGSDSWVEGPYGFNTIIFGPGLFRWDLVIDTSKVSIYSFETIIFQWGESIGVDEQGPYEDVIEGAISTTYHLNPESTITGFHGYFFTPPTVAFHSDDNYTIIRYYTNLFMVVSYPGDEALPYTLKITAVAVPEPATWSYLVIAFGLT